MPPVLSMKQEEDDAIEPGTRECQSNSVSDLVSYVKPNVRLFCDNKILSDFTSKKR